MKKVELYLEEHNISSKNPMNICIFEFAVLQIMKICRILRLDKSHGVLIGLGGSGRKTLTKMSSYIMNQNIINLEVTIKSTIADWRELIKKILTEASLSTRWSTIIITESQSDNNNVMQDIDSMLNLGEIPNLYQDEEFIGFLEKLKDKAKKEGELQLFQNGTISEFQKFFNRKVEENLHLVLILSSVGNTLRQKIRQYPSVVNCCTMAYFEQWPDSALESVAQNELGELIIKKNDEKNLIKSLKAMHNSSLKLAESYKARENRDVYITPSMFLDLIVNLKSLYSSMKKKVESKNNMYTQGVEKITETQKTIAIMSEELDQKRPNLLIMDAELQKILAELDEKEIELKPVYERVKKEEEKVNIEFKKCDVIRAE